MCDNYGHASVTHLLPFQTVPVGVGGGRERERLVSCNCLLTVSMWMPAVHFVLFILVHIPPSEPLYRHYWLHVGLFLLLGNHVKSWQFLLLTCGRRESKQCKTIMS